MSILTALGDLAKSMNRHLAIASLNEIALVQAAAIVQNIQRHRQLLRDVQMLH